MTSVEWRNLYFTIDFLEKKVKFLEGLLRNLLQKEEKPNG